MGSTIVAVVGHGPELERSEGAAQLLRGLGAEVVTCDLWDEPSRLVPPPGQELRALVVEALDRPDLGAAALRALRREPRLREVGSIIAVTLGQVARVHPELGFDDFVLVPYVPAELYARVRNLEWSRSEFTADERIKVGALMIDKSGHEVRVSDRPVNLTAREFALLVYLCERRGRVVTREDAIDQVWGEEYDGGARTVDIHVRRLRKKLGESLPLVTLRGTGYKVAALDEAG